MSSGRNRTARRHEGAHAVVAQPAAQLPEQASGTPRCALTSMMQLVEIASVLQTSDAVCAAVQEMTGGIGETPGVSQVSYRYVINRVLVPMINEGHQLPLRRLGRARGSRRNPQARSRTCHRSVGLDDRIGLDTVLDILETLHEATDDLKYRPSPPLRRLVDAGLLGLKTGQGFYHYGCPTARP